MEIHLTGQRLWSREHIEKVTRQMFGTLENQRNARIEKLIEWADAGSMSLPALNPVKLNGATFNSVASHAAAIEAERASVRLELERGSRGYNTIINRSQCTDVSAWAWPDGMTAGDIMASATPMVDVMPPRNGDVVAVIVKGRPYIGDVTDSTFVLFRSGQAGGLYGVNLTMERLPQARLVYRRETPESAPCAPEEGPDILAYSDGAVPLGRAIERPAVDAPRFGYGGKSVAMGWAVYEE